jgi:hypothetical protein
VEARVCYQSPDIYHLGKVANGRVGMRLVVP